VAFWRLVTSTEYSKLKDHRVLDPNFKENLFVQLSFSAVSNPVAMDYASEEMVVWRKRESF
jgi:hypothetical protein